MKRLLFLSGLVVFSLSVVCCGGASSISTSINCSGNMLLVNNSYGENANKKRDKLTEVQMKTYHKAYHRKRI